MAFTIIYITPMILLLIRQFHFGTHRHFLAGRSALQVAA